MYENGEWQLVLMCMKVKVGDLSYTFWYLQLITHTGISISSMLLIISSPSYLYYFIRLRITSLLWFSILSSVIQEKSLTIGYFCDKQRVCQLQCSLWERKYSSRTNF